MIKVGTYGCALANKAYLYALGPMIKQKVGRLFNDKN